jgi:outer membrane lipoprotein-sorting protein
MKKLSVLLILIGLTITNSYSQTADEIVQKYIEVIGGEEEWNAVKSLKLKGTMSMPGIEMDFESYTKSPNMEYVEVNFQGKKLIDAFDGKTKWSINPFVEGGAVQKVESDETQQSTQTALDIVFINYFEKGHQITLDGKVEINEMKCFKLKLVKQTGEESTYYFSTKSHLPILMQIREPGKEADQQNFSETYFDDYRQIGGGLLMPFSTIIKANGQPSQKIMLQQAELNPLIDDALFNVPE